MLIFGVWATLDSTTVMYSDRMIEQGTSSCEAATSGPIYTNGGKLPPVKLCS